ncbi:unnamed protein product [Natator depressus]
MGVQSQCSGWGQHAEPCGLPCLGDRPADGCFQGKARCQNRPIPMIKTREQPLLCSLVLQIPPTRCCGERSEYMQDGGVGRQLVRAEISLGTSVAVTYGAKRTGVDAGGDCRRQLAELLCRR